MYGWFVRYWSSQQRRHVEMYRDTWRMNLAFFSGNEMYWNIRWEQSKNKGAGTGADPTVMVVYKESQSSHKIDPREDMWTGTFRDPRDINPQGAWPENSITGTIFTVNAWRNDPLHVPHRYAQHRFWRNTPLRAELQPGQPTTHHNTNEPCISTTHHNANEPCISTTHHNTHEPCISKWCRKSRFEMYFAPKHQRFRVQHTSQIQN